MVANKDPIFTGVPRLGKAQISVAESSRTSPTNVGTVLTAGSEGSLVERVRVVATGTTTAGLVRLFVHDGSTYYLVEEIPVSAITPTGTVEAFSADWTPPGGSLVLPSGHSLRATTQNSEAFNVLANGGDF